MRLKSLEIKGFKSFANDTVIHFEEDVIGVVGPNGSGKSNIVDAIRWVLGEQKGKELRLQSMGDVIFNGTKKRKAGAAAQVTLTFDNTRHLLPTEYQTVAISRLLYRSGESEYRLNGVTCRLKDITSLLVDTGIGSNSYAIIALGMVDDILADKENARRRMFEQAAGISKYKKRKHETMLKLRSTSGDLARIEDLLFEIESNLKALEKQARRTQRYVNLKTKYKTKSIQLGIRKVAHIREEYVTLEKQIETEKNIFSQLGTDLVKKEAQLERLKGEHIEDEQSVSSFQRELNLLIGNIRSRENDKNLLEQKVIFIDQTKRRLEAQIAGNEQKVDLLSGEIERLRDSIAEAEANFNKVAGQLEHAASEKSRIEEAHFKAKSRKEALSGEQQALEQEIHQLEKETAIHEARLENNAKSAEVAESELKVINDGIETHSSVLLEIEQKHAEAAGKLLEAEEQERGRVVQLQEMEQEISAAREVLIRTNRSLDAKKHEHNLLKDMVSRLEGFPESIKFLSKSKSWQVGAPLLSDIIYCSPDYRTIVEHLLEPYLNHFVVKDTQEAANAIRILHAAQKGKANFFILDRFGTKPPPVPADLPEGITPLLQFIETDEPYRILVQHLLGDVYLSEGDPTQGKYMESAYGGITLIDPSGTFVRRPYTLSGGSIGLFEGKKLGRKKNLEHLAREIKSLEKKQQKTEGQLEKLRTGFERLKADQQSEILTSLRSTLASVDQELIEKKSLLRHQKERREEISQKIESAALLQSQLASQLAQKLDLLKEKTGLMESSSAVLSKADQEFNRHASQLAGASQTYNEVQLDYIQKENRLDSIRRECRYKEKQKEELIMVDDQYARQMENDMVELGEIETSQKNLEKELHELYARKEVKEADLSEIEKQFYDARTKINELEEQVRKINKEQQNSQYLITQLKDQYADLKFTMSSVSERLDIEFGVKLEEVIGTVELDETPVDDLQAEVERMKYRLENFGDINPMAIEAYEEMKTRYDSIHEQREDILEARESLLETIDEIEATATAKFLDAFDLVRSNFQEVFRSLFTEDDNCDLILENEEDPLESKIRIIAKPKGKRPKSLSQLSGGEKTLTATALLFALYLLKPAPFCIFDEVDAPLDDANIMKFNRIIKKFSRDSQFIIVTHNKLTMAAVDVIYGVYMEETGVSSLSQVDFRSFEHQELLESMK